MLEKIPIHFIAISNNVDSNNQASSEFAPFLNIMNEWYLKDCSNKIKASNKWSETKNCAWFATKAWNSIAPPKDKFSWSAIKNPAGLSLKIKKKKGFVYRKKVNVEVSKTYRVYKKTKKYTKGDMETGGKNKSSSF